MIGTSIVRAHQHGASIASIKQQLMGQPRGGLTSKEMARPERFELPTPRFVVWRLVFGRRCEINQCCRTAANNRR